MSDAESSMLCTVAVAAQAATMPVLLGGLGGDRDLQEVVQCNPVRCENNDWYESQFVSILKGRVLSSRPTQSSQNDREHAWRGRMSLSREVVRAGLSMFTSLGEVYLTEHAAEVQHEVRSVVSFARSLPDGHSVHDLSQRPAPQ